MDMEAAGLGSEEFVGSFNKDATHIAKGKRTKRLKPLSPFAVSSCSSVSGEDNHVSGGADYGSFSSTTTTFEEEDTDQEEEDMANCLILLAQGAGGGGRDSHHHHHHQHHHGEEGSNNNNNKTTEKGSSSTSSRRFAEMATTTPTEIGSFYIYECKTCNRTFPSFQALGGHRASHKKPKVTTAEGKKPPPAAPLPQPPPPPSSPPQLITNYQFGGQPPPHIKSGPSISVQLGYGNNKDLRGNSKPKIHECSVCGSEFASGQALGGHMRRHRSSSSINNAAAAAAVEVKPRNILELDLNLPAPEDDLRDSKFQFTTATQKTLVLSAAPALVGCHY